jgi:hypothetical protein
MSEIGVVITFVVILFGGVLAYSFFSTSFGYEEDENKNYIPDRLERMFGKEIKKKENKSPIKK